MRWGRLGKFAVPLFVCAWAAAPGASGRADDDARAELAAEDLDRTATAGRLLVLAAGLRTGPLATADGPVVVSTDVSPSRAAEAKALREALERGAAALRAAGWNPPAALPDLLVVRVVRPRGVPERFATDDRSVILLRDSQATPRTEVPAAPTRADGPVLLRDLRHAADGARLALADRAAAAAATQGATSLRGLVAERLLVWTGVPETLPPWTRAALREWVAAQAFPPDAAAAASARHACGHLVGGRADVLEKVLDPARTPNDAEAAVLAVWLETLRAGRADLPARLAAIAAQKSAGAKGVGEAFGADAVAAFVETSKALPRTGATCDLAGAPCPVCKGKGRSEAACGSCAGLGQVCCPACGGSELCPVPLCWGGTLGLTGMPRFCRLCSAGKVKCLACSGKLRLPCKGCRSGKVQVDCLLCEGGRIPCPDAGLPPRSTAACAWCREKVPPSACRRCVGVSFLGCRSCRGIGRTVCAGCDGTGMEKLSGGYYRGTCSRCSGSPDACTKCGEGRLACEGCGGKGSTPWADDCPSCEGSRTVSAEAGRLRMSSALRGANAEDAQATRVCLDRAVAFLLTSSRPGDGAFSLREFRGAADEPAGSLEEPTLFSNALCLWALVSAGVGRDDARTEAAWKRLTADARKVADAKQSDAGTQATSLALRALVGAGEDPKGPLVKGLVQKLIKAQRPNGLWGDDLDSMEPGEAFTGLFALESLWLAQRRGAEIPGAVFIKAERGAKEGVRGKDVRSMRRAGYVTATDVASSVALAVLAKAGSLRDRAATFDYRSLPEVQKGLAWLDRHFAAGNEPIFNDGAIVPRKTDAGWAAYMFAVQRVAQLLGVETFGGQRWYVRGAEILRERQLADGSFEEMSSDRLNGPVRTTVTAVLFLVRATPTISDRK